MSNVVEILTIIVPVLGAVILFIYYIGHNVAKLQYKDAWSTEKIIHLEEQIGALWKNSVQHAAEIDKNKIDVLKLSYEKNQK